jgi:hypothetical protein
MSTSVDNVRGWLVNLALDVRNLLGQLHGGTGNAYGYGTGVVQPFSNGEGATLAIGSVVRLKGSYDDNRVVQSTLTSQTDVIGVCVGSYTDDDGISFVPVAPADNVQAAVLLSGVVTVRTTGTVTRGQYAYPSGVAGCATSSGTLSAGSFGIFIESSSSGSARLVLSPAGGAGGSMTFGTPALTLSTSNGAGVATSAIRTDATILAFDATAPAAVGTAATGAAAVAARRDHVHGAGGGTPVTQAVGDVAATGSGPAAAFYDHRHGLTTPALDQLSDVTAPTPSTGDVLAWSGSAWVDSWPGSGLGGVWRPLMDGAVPGEIILDSANGEAVMAFSP